MMQKNQPTHMTANIDKEINYSNLCTLFCTVFLVLSRQDILLSETYSTLEEFLRS